VARRAKMRAKDDAIVTMEVGVYSLRDVDCCVVMMKRMAFRISRRLYRNHGRSVPAN
jgi:hypothetical protein